MVARVQKERKVEKVGRVKHQLQHLLLPWRKKVKKIKEKERLPFG